MTKNPWMKWYPSDWRGDPLVRACTPITRYVWMEMIGLMHEAEPHGHLVLGGRSLDYATLARVIAVDVGVVKGAVKELESRGVFSRTDDGVIYSRRMVRDENRRKTAQKNGKSGGNPALKKQELSAVSDKQDDKAQDKTHIPEARSQSISCARPRVEDQTSPPPAEPLSRNLAAELVACLPPMSGWPIATTIVPPAGISRLIAEGCDIDRHVLPAVRQVAVRAHAAKRAIASWAFFEAAIRDAKAADKSLASAPPPFEAKPIDDDTYRRWLIRWRDRGDWPTGTAGDYIGPPPGSPDCRVPQHLIDEQQVAA